MARSARDNLHSRLVGILKITLPLLALAILSTLFLLSGGINPDDAIPYAEVDIADRLNQPRMTNAGYAGVTRDGAAINLQIAEARPAAPSGTAATDPSADGTSTIGPSARGLLGLLETPDGARLEIAAGLAQMEIATRRVLLSGGVELKSSTGIVAQADGFAFELDQTNVQSTGRVSAEGPFGQVTADHLSLTATPDLANSYVLVFKGDVRLLYQP